MSRLTVRPGRRLQPPSWPRRVPNPHPIIDRCPQHRRRAPRPARAPPCARTGAGAGGARGSTMRRERAGRGRCVCVERPSQIATSYPVRLSSTALPSRPCEAGGRRRCAAVAVTATTERRERARCPSKHESGFPDVRPAGGVPRPGASFWCSGYGDYPIHSCSSPLGHDVGRQDPRAGEHPDWALRGCLG